MNNSLNQQAHDVQQQNNVFASILHWLANLVQLTEEEQGEAGIYFGDPYSREYIFSETIEKNSSHSDDKEKT